MQILLVPDLHESPQAWLPVKAHLARAGYSVEILEYRAPLDDDITPIVDEVVQHMIDETIFVGSGVSGRVGIQLANQKPHQLAHVILMSTPSVPAPGFKQKVQSFLHMLTAPVRILVPWQWRKKLARSVRNARLGSPEKVLYQEIITDTQEAFFQRITVPILLLWPERKTPVSPRIAHAMHEMLESSELRIVAGSTGLLHLTAPKLVAETIIGVVAEETA